MTMYAYYRRELRAMGPSPVGMMPYFCGDGGDTDWTAQRVHYKGERWLERTKHGYMPAEAVEEMRELRAVFDRGGWWTVLAWVAVHTHLQDTLLRAIDGLKRYEAAATSALDYAERLKARVAELEGR